MSTEKIRCFVVVRMCNKKMGKIASKLTWTIDNRLQVEQVGIVCDELDALKGLSAELFELFEHFTNDLGILILILIFTIHPSRYTTFRLVASQNSSTNSMNFTWNGSYVHTKLHNWRLQLSCEWINGINFERWRFSFGLLFCWFSIFLSCRAQQAVDLLGDLNFFSLR